MKYFVFVTSILTASSLLLSTLAVAWPPAEAASMVFTSDTTITTNQTITPGETWTVDSGNLVIAGGVTITNMGTININSGALYTFGLLNVEDGGTINAIGVISDQASGVINIKSGGTLNTFGRLSIFHSLNVADGGIVNVNSGIMDISNTFGGTLNLRGSVFVRGGLLESNGIINVFQAGLLVDNATLDLYSGGITVVSGTLNVTNNGLMLAEGTTVIGTEGILNIEPGGTIYNAVINSHGTINNYGTVNGSAITLIAGTYNNAGATNNFGTYTVNCGALFINEGVFTGNAIINNPCPDTIAPVVTITSAIDGNGNSIIDSLMTESDSVTFGFNASDNIGVPQLDCFLFLDGGTLVSDTPCTSPIAYNGLAPGNYQFIANATDAVGNEGTAVLSFTISAHSATVDDIINEIGDMGLPHSIQSSLLGPLKETQKLLGDGNPNNDRGACSRLGAFVHMVEAKEKSGKLTFQEADELRQMSEEASVGLGC